MIHDTQSAQISQKQDEHNIYIYVIMKTMCPPTYDLNGFVVTHAFGNMMYGSCAQAHALSQNHCGDNWEGSICIYIYIYILYIIYIYIYV